MKKCNVCLGVFDLEKFHKKNSSIDGYTNICKPCKKIKNDDFYQKNKISKLKYQKDYREKNKDIVDAYKKEYNIKYLPEYYKNNREKILKYNHQYQTNKFKTDENFKIKKLLRTRFHHALKNGLKMESVINLAGCSIEEFKSHLESLFLPEMSWENHGEIWEIDHIVPCALFNLLLLEDQKKCFHYSNHQPLFKTTEIAKSFGYDSIIGNRNKPKNKL
jgi:hypothetical protein